MSDCIFCKIIEKELPSDMLYEDDDLVVFRDINPQAPVHILFVPKKHIAMPVDVKKEDEAVLGKIFRIAAEMAEKEGVADNYRILVNNGAKAGQEVFHLHIHLLGGRDKVVPM